MPEEDHPTKPGEASRLVEALREVDPISGGYHIGRSAALALLREDSEQRVEEVVRFGWVEDPERFKNFCALSYLCHAMAGWSAAFDADPSPPEKKRFHGNPTSPPGRAWFRERRWLPFLNGLHEVLRTLGLHETQTRARRILRDLADGHLDYRDARLGPRLLHVLNGGALPKRGRGRPSAELTGEETMPLKLARLLRENYIASNGKWLNVIQFQHEGLLSSSRVAAAGLRKLLTARSDDDRLRGIEIRKQNKTGLWQGRVRKTRSE